MLKSDDPFPHTLDSSDMEKRDMVTEWLGSSKMTSPCAVSSLFLLSARTKKATIAAKIGRECAFSLAFWGLWRFYYVRQPKLKGTGGQTHQPA